MRIPEEQIEEIRSSANIVDIISGYVQLKKRGKNYVGLCPFHQEKTPSFTVSDEKQIYHCFGCAAGGNAFKFLMEYKSISFVESVQEIADYLGVKINYENKVDPAKENELEILYEINTDAAKYFSYNLLKSDEGEIARNYLKDRNIKAQIQKSFGLGYALPGWENYLLYARDNNIDLNRAMLLGLIDKRDNGEFYDKYRDRIIFPIFSPNGRVIAFGGRILQDSAKAAKYLNSPESLIYSKRKSLYGLYHSKEEIRKLDRAILVEGYMDLIALYQHGIKNVVASSGTSLTEEQVKLLSRYTKNIVILFDADEAGQKASVRSIEILLKQDFDVKVLTLPEGDDPDSYVNNYGTQQFEEYLLKAENFLEYQSVQFEKKGFFEDPSKQAEAIREIVKNIALISDELKRSLHIKAIARRFSLREKLIETELEKYLNQYQRKSIKNISVTSEKRIENTVSAKVSNGSKRIGSYERELIRLLFSGDEQVIGLIFDQILPEDFSSKRREEIVGIVLDSYKNNIVLPSSILERLDDEEIKQQIRSITLKEQPISSKWDTRSYNGNITKDTLTYARETVSNFKIQKIKETINANVQQIENSSDEKEQLKLMKLNNKLRYEISEIIEDTKDFLSS